MLAIQEVPRPEPRAGEALVQVKAAAINPSDVKNVAGHFPATTLPRTPGRDFSGIVVAGTKYQGQEVWSSGPGLGMTHDGALAHTFRRPYSSFAENPLKAYADSAGGIASVRSACCNACRRFTAAMGWFPSVS
jgi:NADPH:quinone reductase